MAYMNRIRAVLFGGGLAVLPGLAAAEVIGQITGSMNGEPAEWVVLREIGFFASAVDNSGTPHNHSLVELVASRLVDGAREEDRFIRLALGIVRDPDSNAVVFASPAFVRVNSTEVMNFYEAYVPESPGTMEVRSWEIEMDEDEIAAVSLDVTVEITLVPTDWPDAAHLVDGPDPLVLELAVTAEVERYEDPWE